MCSLFQSSKLFQTWVPACKERLRVKHCVQDLLAGRVFIYLSIRYLSSSCHMGRGCPKVTEFVGTRWWHGGRACGSVGGVLA